MYILFPPNYFTGWVCIRSWLNHLSRADQTHAANNDYSTAPPTLTTKRTCVLIADFCVKKFYWQQIWTEADTAYTNEGCSNNHLIHTTVLKSEKFDWQFSIFAYTAEREINAYHWCTVLLLPYIAYNTQKYRHTRWYRWHKNLPLCLWVAAIRTCY